MASLLISARQLTALCGAALVVGVLIGTFAADVPRGELFAEPPAAVPIAAVRTMPVSTASAAPVTRPVRVRIPAIDVSARVRPVGMNPDGSMEVPQFGTAGWYTKGPRPGESGPAVIVGHVDSYEGPDVFFRLRELDRGDRIRVRRADGSVAVWQVRRLEQTPKDRLPADRIWSSTRRPLLRLITCGGEFDQETRHYLDNIIVYATPLL